MVLGAAAAAVGRRGQVGVLMQDGQRVGPYPLSKLGQFSVEPRRSMQLQQTNRLALLLLSSFSFIFTHCFDTGDSISNVTNTAGESEYFD